MYLMIENAVKHVPSVELLRMLGSSTSRGVDERVGMFGSGFPYSLALLAREGLLERVKLCMGTDVYTFFTKDAVAKDSDGNKVMQSEICMKKQGGGTWNLNISTDFGAMDWNKVVYAVREFVSNAVDGARVFDGTTKSVSLDTSIPDDTRLCRAKTGFVRVYIPLTSAIKEYVDNIEQAFLCLRPEYDAEQRILLNCDGGPARLYRKGVLVGEMGTASLFHYNIPMIELKESRNVDSYAAETAAAKALGACTDPDILRRFLDVKVDGRDVWEKRLSTWYLDVDHAHDLPREERELAKTAWREAIGQSSLATGVICENEIAHRIVASKGLIPLDISGEFAKLVGSLGVRRASDVLDVHELSGKEVIQPNDHVIDRLCDVWAWLETIGMTFGKPLPNIALFRQNSVEGGMKGYYIIGEGTVYVRDDLKDDHGADLFQTIVEECGHYITGATDYTRDFQEWMCKLATAEAMRRLGIA